MYGGNGCGGGCGGDYGDGDDVCGVMMVLAMMMVVVMMLVAVMVVVMVMVSFFPSTLFRTSCGCSIGEQSRPFLGRDGLKRACASILKAWRPNPS